MVSNCVNTAAWLNTRQESTHFDCLVVNIVFTVTGTDDYPSLRHSNSSQIIESKAVYRIYDRQYGAAKTVFPTII